MAVPHLVRLWVEESDHKITIPLVALTGACIALLCDMIAQALVSIWYYQSTVLPRFWGSICNLLSAKKILDKENYISLNKVTVGYGSCPVLTDVSFILNPGELICLLGANGKEIYFAENHYGNIMSISGEILLKERV